MKAGKLKPAKSLTARTSEIETSQFPIVGIGASAGGLEALEQFLSYVPEKSGMAFVVIQHLDPTQKGMLPELLQRITKMKVFQVKDRMLVMPDCVYVIPPNKTMSILKGMLHLFKPVEARGMRLPVDYFLNALAKDRKERSIGVILSGMGSDGSIGLRAIKEREGIAMVQDPSDAKFDSMPRNAIDSVMADIVAPASVLHSRLIEFLKHIPLVKPDPETEIKDKSSLEKIIILLRTYTGNDFSLYKKNTIYRRIERRMGIHKIDKISSYVRFLQGNPNEVDILFKELMIGVTSFFRDPETWETLKETVIPDIISNLQPGSILRAWVPGCSTGEEAYSLAILFKEVIEKINPHGGFSLQIFATDLDNDAIETARKGIFHADITADVSQERLNRFFLITDEGYFINTEIRETVVFAQHNVIMHPPFTRIDFLSCRNLLIYMEPELQKKLLGLFYFSLNAKGIILLGSSETLGKQSHLFTSLDIKQKIFKRAVITQSTETFDFLSEFSRTKSANIKKQLQPGSTVNIQTLADQLLLQHVSLSGVLVNETGDIVYISGHTGNYLEPAVGKANMNIFAMLRKGLRNEFPVAFRKAITKKEIVLMNNVKVCLTGGVHTFNVSIQWIEKPEPLKGMVLIIFTDVPEISDNKQRTGKVGKTLDTARQSELEKELKNTHEKLQNTLEEMRTSKEDLNSTNEELQSANEELQSTNEELMSSKEEMQSLNEELQTLNAELQSKVDDFTRVNNDLKNLLNSTDIATLFLDRDLQIRRFTIQSTKIFKLRKSDIGRPFTDLVSDLIYPELSDDAYEVLKTLIFIQKPVPTIDGRWFSVRIMPYRTANDRIDGLVITFINISDLKKIELKLHETEQMNSLLVDSSSDIIIKLSTDNKILEFNPQSEIFFGRKRADVINHNFFRTFIPENLRMKVGKDFNNLHTGLLGGKLMIPVIAADDNTPIVMCFVNILLNNMKMAAGMILTIKK